MHGSQAELAAAQGELRLQTTRAQEQLQGERQVREYAHRKM